MCIRDRYHFSQQKTPRISQARAVELLGDMFSLKRTSKRETAEPTPEPAQDAPAATSVVVHVYELLDDAPLGEVVATFAKKIRQLSVYVATNETEDAVDSGAAAFAFPSAASSRWAAYADDTSDILDWFLSTGAHKVNYTWQSATAGW